MYSKLGNPPGRENPFGEPPPKTCTSGSPPVYHSYSEGEFRQLIVLICLLDNPVLVTLWVAWTQSKNFAKNCLRIASFVNADGIPLRAW